MKVGDEQGEGKRASGGAPSFVPQHLPTEEAYDIRIARDGTWYHEGDPIRRIELAKLFATVLRRDEAGDYWLITPAERGRIRVEDVPFVAVEMAVRGEGEDQVLSFRTNLDEWVEAGPDHPIRVVHKPDTGEPAPYVLVRQGLEARIERSVFYEMVDRAVPNGKNEVEVGVWSRKTFFALGRLPGD
jgi:hypothetical protein